MTQSPEFRASVAHLQSCITELTGELTLHSVPLYSPRHAGYMSTDLSCESALLAALSLINRCKQYLPCSDTPSLNSSIKQRHS